MSFVQILLALTYGGILGSVQAEQVVALDTKGFDAAIRGSTLAFVEFYAPWCGHCKKLAPEWEEVAGEEAHGSPKVLIAKVDAIEEKTLASRFEVEGFPTLKLFRGSPDVSVKYDGPRTKIKLLEWLQTWKTGSLVKRDVKIKDVGRGWGKGKKVQILGFNAGKSETMRTALDNLAFVLNPKGSVDLDVPVGEAASSEDLTTLGFSSLEQDVPCVVMFRDFDMEDKKALFVPDDGWTTSNFGSLRTWTSERLLPALIPANEESEKSYLQDINPGYGIVGLFSSDEKHVKVVQSVAVEFKGSEPRLKWVSAAQDDYGKSLGKSVNLEESDFPEVVLWEFGDTEDKDKVYRFSQHSDSGITKEGVLTFVQQWQAGSLSAEKDPVTSLTNENFDRGVISNKKDVLVEFYAPWCGHCKSLAPVYKQLAKHYQDDSRVRITKVDATAHRIPGIEVKSFPTIRLFAKGKKHAPIEAVFKAGRDLQSLIDFVEENRVTRPKGAKADGPSPKVPETKQAAKAQQVPETSSKVASTTTPAALVGGGVWIFDDMKDLARRGEQLSPAMADSRGGFSLVQVGEVGILLWPGEARHARATRWFPSSQSAREYVSNTNQETASSAVPAAPGSFSCPIRADKASCQAWCEAVSPKEGSKLQAAFGGRHCKDIPKNPSFADRPSCSCYDPSYSTMFATCTSTCSDSDSVDQVCAAGDSSCAALEGEHSGKYRYLLYDAKYGEGFNLQREVYPRAGWVVAQLNKALEEKCEGRDAVGECAPWALVLPPWCKVVHWWTGPDHVHWSEFFDAATLRTAKVPVIEFHEYVAEVGSNQIDLAVAYTTEHTDMNSGELTTPGLVVDGGSGEFLGWADLGRCSRLPEHSSEAGGRLNVMYGGYCNGGVSAAEFRCAVLKKPWPYGIVDMLKTQTARSVLLKAYDFLLSPDMQELDNLGLRESMLFSQDIRKLAEAFMVETLGGRPYLAAHCRRTDFLRVRKGTTPNAKNIAATLNQVMAAQGLDQVFIATDAPSDLREALRSQVHGQVFFPPLLDDIHPGKQAAVETWIAARAQFFVGTIESRFTMSIQIERGFLDQPEETSKLQFCKKHEEGKECSADVRRMPKKRSSTRKAYFK